MPPSKRKREEGDDDGKEPKAPRVSGMQRKKRSFGEEFEEEWSPSRGTKKPTPQQPKATGNKPGPSSAPDPPPEEDPTPEAEDTVTWPSSEKYWKQLLPTNHRKHLYFIRKGFERISKHCYVSVWAKFCKIHHIIHHAIRCW